MGIVPVDELGTDESVGVLAATVGLCLEKFGNECDIGKVDSIGDVPGELECGSTVALLEGSSADAGAGPFIQFVCEAHPSVVGETAVFSEEQLAADADAAPFWFGRVEVNPVGAKQVVDQTAVVVAVSVCVCVIV